MFALSVHGMESATEVWTAWRALFLPDPARAGDGTGRRDLQSFFDADLRTSLEGRDGDGFEVPGLGDEWKMGYPKSPM